jgi:hypothetical protein
MPRRPYQDYSSFLNYGTCRWWQDVQSVPQLAMEMFAERFCKAGLRNPSELKTSAAFAAAITVVQYGTSSSVVAECELRRTYDNFKASQLVFGKELCAGRGNKNRDRPLTVMFAAKYL